MERSWGEKWTHSIKVICCYRCGPLNHSYRLVVDYVYALWQMCHKPWSLFFIIKLQFKSMSEADHENWVLFYFFIFIFIFNFLFLFSSLHCVYIYIYIYINNVRTAPFKSITNNQQQYFTFNCLSILSHFTIGNNNYKSIVFLFLKTEFVSGRFFKTKKKRKVYFCLITVVQSTENIFNFLSCILFISILFYCDSIGILFDWVRIFFGFF